MLIHIFFAICKRMLTEDPNFSLDPTHGNTSIKIPFNSVHTGTRSVSDSNYVNMKN